MGDQDPSAKFGDDMTSDFSVIVLTHTRPYRAANRSIHASDYVSLSNYGVRDQDQE